MFTEKSLEYKFVILSLFCIGILNAYSVILAEEHADWTTDEEEKLIVLYRDGKLISEIYDKIGKSYESATQKLEELKNGGKLKIYSENENYRVDMVEEIRCPTCPKQVKFIFNIYDKKTSISDKFTLDDASIKDVVYNVILWGKKLAILRRRGEKLIYVVSIVDAEKKQTEDTFWAYKLTPSPSKRFFAYVKFYSGHGEEANDIVVIYDLAKSANENRLPGYESSDTESGLPIYPDSNLHPRSYNQAIVPEHSIISPFLWSKDEGIIFFDIHGSQNYMIKVDLKAGIENPDIRRRPVEAKILIREDIPSEKRDFYQKEIERSHRFPFVVETLLWDTGGDRVIVRPSRRGNPWIMDELLMELP